MRVGDDCRLSSLDYNKGGYSLLQFPGTDFWSLLYSNGRCRNVEVDVVLSIDNGDKVSSSSSSPERGSSPWNAPILEIKISY